jgi:hypothetical protein
VELVVRRHVLGQIESASHDGRISMTNLFESADHLPTGSAEPGEVYPFWWAWHGWPYWWHHFNGVGRVDWTITLQPGETADLDYTWQCIWQ